MKVVIWGHKLYSHTHSFIHDGFFKAFKYMGYDVSWYDNSDDISNLNFDDTLFLTEGQVDANIPINKTCKYVLHNCNGEKYSDIDSKNKVNLQFFHKEVLGYQLSKINDYTFIGNDVIYQPWATDLLPNEFSENDAKNERHKKDVYWIGSYDPTNSQFENHTELDPFFQACRGHGLDVKMIDPWGAPISAEENRRLINNSYISPSINGKWQKDKYYLPCRLFKNISYGHLGVTNNEYANKIFDNKLIYDQDTYKLFYKCVDNKNSKNIINQMKFLINEVKNKHTFVNRAQIILDFFG